MGKEYDTTKISESAQQEYFTKELVQKFHEERISQFI
jgi:hypothetical protein